MANARIVRAKNDCIIPPHLVKQLEIEGYFIDEREWLIEKILLEDAKEQFLAVPNTLISSSKLWLLVANTTNVPRIIHQGELVGELQDPTSFINSPPSVYQLDQFISKLNQIATLIASLRDLEDEVEPSLPPLQDHKVNLTELVETTPWKKVCQ